jgi:hypothetical protein
VGGRGAARAQRWDPFLSGLAVSAFLHCYPLQAQYGLRIANNGAKTLTKNVSLDNLFRCCKEGNWER